MACFEHGKFIELNNRETLSLPDVRGATLRVARGTVWITQQDDTQDIVLRTGDTWTVEHDGLTLLEAQSDVSLCVIGSRIEELITIRERGAARHSPAAWARNALAAFFATPRRTAAPYV